MEKSQIEKIALDKLKVAIVHDFLDTYGGAERVLGMICEMFPKAPIYTLLYDEEKMRGKFEDREIRVSFLQSLPRFLKKRKKYLLPLMPTVPETFDLRDFDLVISSSGAWSKGIVTRLNTIHVAYLHSPMRFVWDYKDKYFEDSKNKIGICKRLFLTYLRIWDFEAAQRPDVLVANSNFTKGRINKYYRREAEIVYPGLDIFPQDKESNDNFKEKNYFLFASRLSPYKKAELVVEVFNKMGLPLIIIGEGEEQEKIKKIAKENIKVIGWQSDEELKGYYKNCRAFIFPAVDDFGLTTIEAMSYGKPVIAIRDGGAKEIIKEGISGEFFDAQTIEVLADGVRRFLGNENKYQPDIIRKEAEKFSKENFKRNFSKIVEEEVNKSNLC